jgi:hypothetical protein
MSRRVAGWHIINPGSVGVPLDGELTASYALLEGDESGWQPAFYRLPYDHDAVLREFERQHFVDRFGIMAQLVVREFELARLQVLPFNLWRQQYAPDSALSAELLAAFDQVDHWAYAHPDYRVNLDL